MNRLARRIRLCASRLTGFVLILGIPLASNGLAQAQQFASSPAANTGLRLPRRLARQMARSSRTTIPRLPATATSEAVSTPCPQEAQDLGAMCGYVKVPLDREHPGGAKIRIFFELFSHSNPGPAESAILANPGGPGAATTQPFLAGFFLSYFASNLDVHDLLLIDDRGRGLSITIDCEELQHGTAPFDQAETDCAAQLGGSASRYGTGDIAIDTDAVRAALGYDKVDYLGFSYGGVDVTAYATRFGEHLRSIVLHAPMGAPSLEPFGYDGFRPRAVLRLVRLACLRSPTCAPDHPDPEADLEWLIDSVRSDPVQGNAHDVNGNLVHVRIDEGNLLFLSANPTGYFTSTGELPAAAGSLKNGDAAPLLRLGAEGLFPLVGDSGDPTNFSIGAEYATWCMDAKQPWDWSAPVPERQAQYEDVVSHLPADVFAPFSKASVTDPLVFSSVKQCLWWQEPSPPSPVVPAHAAYPHVPTLVLVGDMDTNVPLEEAGEVAALFPDSTFAAVPEAGHGDTFFSDCTNALVPQFIETLQVGDMSCLLTPDEIAPAVGRFPLLAKDARPAEIDPDGRNKIGVPERKVVTVAVAAATDALQRNILGATDGAGLRAGTFHADYGDVVTISLTGCAFAKDVLVSGTVIWGPDNLFTADLTVSGTGTAGGSLHVEGAWDVPGLVGKFKVSGALGGRNVAVLVPEA